MDSLQVKIIAHPTDESAKLELIKHLNPLINLNIIQLLDSGDDEDLFGGEETTTLLPDLVFLLLSPELLSDNNLLDIEIMPAFEDKNTHVVSVLVKDCDYSYTPFFREYIKNDRGVFPRAINNPKPVAINNSFWGDQNTAITHILSSQSSKGKGHNLAKQIEKLQQKGARKQNTMGFLSRPQDYRNEPDEQNEGTYNPNPNFSDKQQTTTTNSRSKHKVLFMTANPKDTQAIQLTKEYKEVETLQHVMDQQDRYEVKLVPNTSTQEFMQRIMAEQPRILHFSGHGTGQAGLIFHDSNDNAQFANSQALGAMFSVFKSTIQIDCVILNACYSIDQAQAIAQYVPFVIGTNQEVADNKAITFTRGFYTTCFAGMPYDQAFFAGRAQILMEGLPEGAEIILLKEGKVIA